MPPNQTLCLTDVQRVLSGLFEGDLHAKRILSLANACQFASNRDPDFASNVSEVPRPLYWVLDVQAA